MKTPVQITIDSDCFATAVEECPKDKGCSGNYTSHCVLAQAVLRALGERPAGCSGSGFFFTNGSLRVIQYVTEDSARDKLFRIIASFDSERKLADGTRLPFTFTAKIQP